LVNASWTIVGIAGLVGFVLALIAWARFERPRALAVLGLVLNGPFVLLLILRVHDFFGNL
jgi:hypothetical protein